VTIEDHNHNLYVTWKKCLKYLGNEKWNSTWVSEININQAKKCLDNLNIKELEILRINAVRHNERSDISSYIPIFAIIFSVVIIPEFFQSNLFIICIITLIYIIFGVNYSNKKRGSYQMILILINNVISEKRKVRRHKYIP